ncbi:EH signature domain-containing protein [Polynucleobacter antarcticus]|uniref:Zorya protein ZorC EH domain-containing protein n=1 Tax=Polynucleobacter antarcticus TaxID=1743162 RepID=A0A6M9PQ14_9BURK|nr:EH signature domain-containing protein [Polynucleobacter antarcticus]QKM62679.1 hypothetical protein DCO16_06190 [Polynucleobacter antarcticus]
MSFTDLLKHSLANLNNSFQYELRRDHGESHPRLAKVHKKITDEFTFILKPKDEVAYAAARDYLNGSLAGNPGEYEIISFVLTKPIAELGGVSVATDNEKLRALLNRYAQEFENDLIDGIFWFGVFQSYFQAQKSYYQGDSFFSSQRLIRNFLSKSWPYVMKNASFSTNWMKSIDANLHLLSESPCDMYGAEWLSGSEARVKQIKLELQIPDASWFWDEFFKSCLKTSLSQSDAKFKESIPLIISLLNRHPSYLDNGLRALLDRYRASSDIREHIELKDFALVVWKNPKLRSTGASKWIHVADPTWRMVLTWVQEANLRLFFELLKRRGVPDPHGRLNFWMQYINQITFTRLVLGDDMRRYLNSHPELKEHFKNDVESYANLSGANGESGLDAFIMEINGHLIVEFNPHGGCYVYKKSENTFNVNASSLDASTSERGLKERYYSGSSRGPDIVHREGWQFNARTYQLPAFGIFDDARAGKLTSTTTSFSIDKYF